MYPILLGRGFYFLKVYGMLVKPYSLNMPHRVEAKWARVVMCWSVSLTRTKVIFNARRTIRKLFAMLVRRPISSETSQKLTCLSKNTKKTTKLRLSKSEEGGVGGGGSGHALEALKYS